MEGNLGRMGFRPVAGQPSGGPPRELNSKACWAISVCLCAVRCGAVRCAGVPAGRALLVAGRAWIGLGSTDARCGRGSVCCLSLSRWGRCCCIALSYIADGKLRDGARASSNGPRCIGRPWTDRPPLCDVAIAAPCYEVLYTQYIQRCVPSAPRPVSRQRGSAEIRNPPTVRREISFHALGSDCDQQQSSPQVDRVALEALWPAG